MRLNFQDPVTGIMEGIIEFHHSVMFYLIVVIFLVAWMLFSVIKEFGLDLYLGNIASVEETLIARKVNTETRNITHGRLIEIIWTLTPALVLVMIAVPSFVLLYSIDELIEPTLTLKAIGHQWYWSYEYSDFEEDISFDSYMIPEEELEEGQLRLLEVDRKVWLPVNTNIRVLVTATDVLHCWAVPSMGVKIDCVPGRLNQASIFMKREGIFYGQCSELCGVNHGFMPICIKAVPMELFNHWVNYNLNE